MKKIFILPILFLALLSCSKSKNDEVKTSNTMPTELIGTWKFTGYYDDQATGPDNNNFHSYNQSFLVTFNNNETFISNANGDITNGTYTVDSNSVLKCMYNSTASMPISLNSLKIYSLTSSFFESFDNIDTNPLRTNYRFEKVVTTPTISGKQ